MPYAPSPEMMAFINDGIYKCDGRASAISSQQSLAVARSQASHSSFAPIVWRLSQRGHIKPKKTGSSRPFFPAMAKRWASEFASESAGSILTMRRCPGQKLDLFRNEPCPDQSNFFPYPHSHDCKYSSGHRGYDKRRCSFCPKHEVPRVIATAVLRGKLFAKLSTGLSKASICLLLRVHLTRRPSKEAFLQLQSLQRIISLGRSKSTKTWPPRLLSSMAIRLCSLPHF